MPWSVLAVGEDGKGLADAHLLLAMGHACVKVAVRPQDISSRLICQVEPRHPETWGKSARY
jgi:hypothetical protein